MNTVYIQLRALLRERRYIVMLAGVCFLAAALGLFFGNTQWFFIFTAGAAAALGALIFRFPFLGILLITFFLPFERIGTLETGAGTIRLTQVLLAITIIVAWLTWARGRARPRPYPLLIPLCMFLVANVLGLLQSPNISYSIEILLITIFTILASVCVSQLVTDKQRLTVLVNVLLLSAFVVCLFGIFQFLGDLAGLPTSVTGLRDLYTKDVFGFPRIQSTALEPLYFANYLLLPLSVAYALFLHRWKRFPAWLLFGLLILFGGNLLLTVSRGGYAGMAASLVVITLLSLRQFLQIRILVPVIIGIIIVLIGMQKFLNVGDFARLNVETFTEHVVAVFSGPSFQERVETIKQAHSAFWQSPWVGIGPGSFGPFVAIHPLVKPDGGWQIVNNESFELLAETGLLGFLSVMAMIMLLIIRSFRAEHVPYAQPAFVRAVHIGLLGALIGVLTQYQTFSVLYIMHVWFLIGLLIAVQSLLLGKQKEDGYG